MQADSHRIAKFNLLVGGEFEFADDGGGMCEVISTRRSDNCFEEADMKTSGSNETF